MKSITLTEEHKSKLLEMCKVLFPEMFTPTIQDNGYINYSNTGKTIDYEDKFHWFEFCMTHLAKKLLNPYDFTLYQTTGNFLYKHPIDYLYEQFKLLK